MDKKNLTKVMPVATALLTVAAIGTAQAAGHSHHLPSGLRITETETIGSDTHTVGSDTHTVDSDTHTVGTHIDTETVESETVNAHHEPETVESESHTVIAPATHPVIVRAPESHSGAGQHNANSNSVGGNERHSH